MSLFRFGDIVPVTNTGTHVVVLPGAYNFYMMFLEQVR
jgi:hypothetical protein